MNDLYKQLGFKRPEFLENPQGIRIYIGTEGDDDWGVEVPNSLIPASSRSFKYDKNFMFYLLTEDEALEIAKKFTKINR